LLEMHDKEYLYANYNWKVDEKWYLYDKEWNKTNILPTQIKTVVQCYNYNDKDYEKMWKNKLREWINVERF
jgi:hypothetical protein